MGTQVTHEPAPSGSPENSPTPPTGSESTSQSTQPTEIPTAPAIDPKYVQLLEGTIAEQNRRFAAMEQRLAAGATAEPPKPVKTKEELRQEFYDNPNEATRSVIREELAATIGPLQEFVSQFRGQTAVDRLIQQAQLNPRFKTHWSPALEAYVRDQASTMNPQSLNESTLNFLVVSGIGLKAAGMLDGDTQPPAPPAPAPTGTQPPTPAPMPTPPYMRPSGPAGPSDQPPRARIEPLNENERRLLREYNAGKPADKQMTDEQFRKWQELPSADVATANFDKPRTP